MASTITATNCLQALSLIFGILSALLWVMCAFAKDKKNPIKSPAGDYSLLGLHKALEKQAKLNAGAAICAAVAIFSQTLQTFLS